jgi:hypothetical protein
MVQAKNVKSLSLTESGVYELGYKKTNEVIYIGKSETSIRARLLDHIEKKKFSGITHFRKRRTSPQEAPRAEKRLLIGFVKKYGKRPKLNKIIPSERDWLDKYIWG